MRRRGGMGSAEPYRPGREGAGFAWCGRGMGHTLRNRCDARLHLVDDEGGRAADLVVEGAGPAVVLLGVPVDGLGPALRGGLPAPPRAGRARRPFPGRPGRRRGPAGSTWAAVTRSRRARRSWPSRCPVQVVQRQEAEQAVFSTAEAVEGGARGLLGQLFTVEGEIAAPEGPPVVPVVIAQCPDRSHPRSLASSGSPGAGSMPPDRLGRAERACRSASDGPAISASTQVRRVTFPRGGRCRGREVSPTLTVESLPASPVGPAPVPRSQPMAPVCDGPAQPASFRRVCVLGWLASIALFVGLSALRGPSTIDSQESTLGTWAIAHGGISCAYPSVRPVGDPALRPLYPLLSGGIAAMARIGHDVPFPPAVDAWTRLPQWGRRNESVGSALAVVSPDNLDRLRGMACADDRRDRMVTSFGPGSLRMGARHPPAGRGSATCLDVRADVLSPPGRARTWTGAVSAGLRPPRPVVGGRRPAGSGVPLPAIRPACRGAAVHTGAGGQQDTSGVGAACWPELLWSSLS